MSVFTPVDTDQALTFLGELILDEARPSADLGLEAIEEGADNTNYCVSLGERRLVLTLYEGRSVDDAAFVVALHAHLHGSKVPVPAPIARRDGHLVGTLAGRPAAVFEALPGTSVTVPSAAQLSALGHALAEFHIAARTFGRTRAPERGPAWWRGALEELAPELSTPQRERLREELRFQDLYRGADLPRGIIHGDLFRDNVLFQGETLSGVLDLTFAGAERWLFDLAVTTNDWCVNPDHSLDADRVETLLTAYHRRRPLTPLERGAWPVMLRAAALRFWLSRLFDAHRPRPGQVVTRRDPAPFAALLDNHIRHFDDHQRLWVASS